MGDIRIISPAVMLESDKIGDYPIIIGSSHSEIKASRQYKEVLSGIYGFVRSHNGYIASDGNFKKFRVAEFIAGVAGQLRFKSGRMVPPNEVEKAHLQMREDRRKEFVDIPDLGDGGDLVTPTGEVANPRGTAPIVIEESYRYGYGLPEDFGGSVKYTC